MQTIGLSQKPNSAGSSQKPISAWKIARWGILLIAVVVVIQMLRNPTPIATPPDPQTRTQLAQQFQQKMGDLESARARGDTGAEAQFSSEEISAAFVAEPPASAPPTPQTVPGTEEQMPEAKNAEVVFEGDSVIGQFTTNRYGKDIVVTLRAHVRAEGGYLQIEPTQFKVGELAIPISFVDSVVQKKLSEPEIHERLKLPDWVGDVRIENSQLVLREKYSFTSAPRVHTIAPNWAKAFSNMVWTKLLSERGIPILRSGRGICSAVANGSRSRSLTHSATLRGSG